MVDIETLFKVTYGMFIVCSGSKAKGNGFISNTVFQVTADPPRFAASCHKNNYTAGFIAETGVFSVSVLHKEAATELFSRFGYKSGRELDKMEGMQVTYGETGVPIVLDDTVAFLECKVVQTIDLGTHFLFIGDLLNTGIVDNRHDPMTYHYYRSVKKAASPKNAPTYIDPEKVAAAQKTGPGKYRCTVCGYVYDESIEKIKFDDLPDDWVCPLCGETKSGFVVD